MIVGKPYTEGVRYPRIKTLLDEGLRRLDYELDLLFHMANGSEQYLFEYNERALVGLFNNALIRHNDEYCTFQEYHVYERDCHLLGRADLLIVHNDFDFLIEAKKWVYDGKEYTDKDINDLFKESREQVEKYYKAEKKYFTKAQTFLGVLIFENVHKNDFQTLKNQYSETGKPEKGVHFDAFYATEQNGLMVYGQVFLPEESSARGNFS